MSSMSSLVLTPLDTLEASLNALTSTLTTSTSFASAPSTAQALLSADDALASALTTLRTHQNNFARILNLKDEAERLQEEIRSVVRRCGELRDEVEGISAGILDDEDGEKGEEKRQDVDYKTLLAFAARIGRHNAAAAREAELESSRQAARKTTAKSLSNGNGTTPTNGQSGPRENDRDPLDLPEQSQNDLAFLAIQVAAERAAKGMAFPAAEILRNGALGQLQLAREVGGEDAVEMEVEKWIREAEGDETIETSESIQAAGAPVTSAVPPTQPQQPRPPRRTSQAAPRPAAPAKKLELDMWNEDSSDEDD